MNSDHPPILSYEGLRVFPVRTPTLPPATHTNCYILGDRELVVIDPASPYEEEQKRLEAYLEDILSEQRCRLSAIWLTHHHPDHIGGVESLKRRFGLPVLAEAQCRAKVNFKIDGILCGGSVQALEKKGGGQWRWRALHTPGHAQDHLCFYEEDLKYMITGDVVVGRGTVLIAPPEGHMATYLHTLERLRRMEISHIFPAHGPVVDQGHERIDLYLAHRRQREKAIFAALAKEASVMDVVNIVYQDVPKEAYPLAALNVQAHLEKLVDEGRIRVHEGIYKRS